MQICAGVSSMLARAARLSPKNCRRMASVGMAAGIAAAFNAPIAAITFTLEELIGDLDQTMLSGVIVAAALAAVVEHSILGTNPSFTCNRTYTLGNASSLIWYALLGLLAAIVSVAFTDSLLWLRAWFKRLNAVPKWVHPAIGGLATGCLAVLALALFHLNGIAGDPYKTLTLALTGDAARAVHGGVLRAQAGRHGLLLCERRLGRHLCPGAVHGRHAGRRGRLHRRNRLPPLRPTPSAPLPWWAWARSLPASSARP